VFLQIYVVEFRNEVFQLLFPKHLLDEVLPVVPSPWLVYFAKVLYDETALRNSFLVDADGSLALCVHPETSFILCELVVSGQKISVEVVAL
jgi:hypothetical protein